MLVVHVHIHVKDEFIEKFKNTCFENATKSIKEAGIARFDVLQKNDDPTRFILNEVYKDENAPAAHKETEHYRKWRAEVENMMAEPRYSEKFSDIYPQGSGER